MRMLVSSFRLLIPSLLLAVLLTGCGKSSQPPRSADTDSPASSPAGGMLELTFTYGSEKEDWIKETTAAFNTGNHRIGSGKTIRVNALPMGSGECMEEIVAGTRQTHLTSPASMAYIELANAQWRAKSGHDLLGKTDNLLLSPVVIAMWRPMAEALGWPNKPVGWTDILALAQDPQGWASLGHPEWGRFRFGHTHRSFPTAD